MNSLLHNKGVLKILNIVKPKTLNSFGNKFIRLNNTSNIKGGTKMKNKYAEEDEIISKLSNWNEKVTKYLDQNKGTNPNLALESLQYQSVLVTRIAERTRYIENISTNTKCILVTLGILTTFIISVGIWLLTNP